MKKTYQMMSEMMSKMMSKIITVLFKIIIFMVDNIPQMVYNNNVERQIKERRSRQWESERRQQKSLSTGQV